LFYYCVETVLSERQCEAYDLDHIEGRERTMFGLLGIQFLLSTVCVLGALCRMCCCNGGKTVCHGIAAFMAGIAGIGAVAMYSINVENVFMKLLMPRLDWGFYIYAAGAGVTTVSSFMLCFASPQNPLTNVILSNIPAVPQVSVYSRLDNTQSTQSTGAEMVPVSDGYGYDQRVTGYNQAGVSNMAPGRY